VSTPALTLEPLGQDAGSRPDRGLTAGNLAGLPSVTRATGDGAALEQHEATTGRSSGAH
jgi:hypothetical protein